MGYKLDELDRSIIAALHKDSRVSFVKLGKDLGVADTVVHFRVKNLLEKGVIKKFTVILGARIEGFVAEGLEGRVSRLEDLCLGLEQAVASLEGGFSDLWKYARSGSGGGSVSVVLEDADIEVIHRVMGSSDPDVRRVAKRILGQVNR